VLGDDTVPTMVEETSEEVFEVGRLPGFGFDGLRLMLIIFWLFLSKGAQTQVV